MKYLANVVINGRCAGCVYASNPDEAKVRTYLALAKRDFSPLLNVDFTVLSLEFIPTGAGRYRSVNEIVGEMRFSITADSVNDAEKAAGKILSEMKFNIKDPIWVIEVEEDS